ncbi:hypothetical protein MHI37_09165 [Paenibacillus sp. FSL H8-0548]|uniref:hypothetical protein n=1 Tax=Paenibacillus sp. FSL H8-0548 TaxID=1920422 RepID=UPI0015C2E109|nr:hypothetical protein [Paenibacillus sp. FSL H8-0548]
MRYIQRGTSLGCKRPYNGRMKRPPGEQTVNHRWQQALSLQLESSSWIADDGR